ncbi:MAG: uroporphyrinogen decarboxylase [Bdellovibrionales bacterium]|nr:uroporphyrinogen decarboxylase [Bdellovibrionales bacterium]
MGLFNDRDKGQVPVWFMRQAGRYHDHYQNIKKNHSFMEMCKDSTLAEEITLGPIEEFNFDAAILFSDLLFPLEQLNLGLTYVNGPPELSFHLKEKKDFEKIKVLAPATEFYQFQKKALQLLKKSLPANKTLLGFVGAPFTLYTYATEGAHKGNLISSKQGLYDGRFNYFLEFLLPQLKENMAIQAEGGADAICLFDTAVGELCFSDFKNFIVPAIKSLTASFKEKYPEKKIVYYSKFTHIHYLKELNDPNIDVLGIDWRMDLREALETLSDQYYIQGNIDPCHLHLTWDQLEGSLNTLWSSIKDLGETKLSKWIMGLGHGVLPLTPQQNVAKAVDYIHRNFKY